MDSIRCVVPTLNSAETLDVTLHSLLSQRGISLEIIVADSGSTDGTLEICRRRGVEVIYVDPGNMYRAINKGLSGAVATWLAYLNSDDWLYPESLDRLVSLGRSSLADIVYGDCDYVDAGGRFIFSFESARPRQLTPLFRLGRMGFAQPAAIFRRTAYERLGGFDEKYRYKSDADFFIRALEQGLRFVRLAAPPVACFRVHDRQLSIRNKSEINDEARLVFDRLSGARKYSDRLSLLHWMMRNSPHYLTRIIRASTISGRMRMPRTIESSRSSNE